MDIRSIFEKYEWPADEDNQSPGYKEASANIEKWWFKFLENQNLRPEWTSKGPSVERCIQFMKCLADSKPGRLDEKITQKYFKTLCIMFRKLVSTY